MYIIKNALRSISRSKGRSILIGIIIFVISISSCISLSIREASKTAQTSAVESLSITATITPDREAMMKEGGDPSERKEALAGMQGLSLDELETYAAADSVKDFYYTVSASLNGNSISPVDTTGISDDEDSDGDSSSQEQEFAGMTPDGQEMGGGFNMHGGGRMGVQGDFTVTGYSSDQAMTDFVSGVSSINDGSMFEEGTADATCVINQELATYNDLTVGDAIVLANPNDEEETYTLTICGIYKKETAGDSSMDMMGGFSTAADSANQIYMSYDSLKEILDTSESNATTATDEDTGMTTTTALQSSLNGTYSFADVDAYETFQDEARELGLDDSYTISSSDVSSYEESLKPLQNLSKYAGYFLIVILAIGAVILIVFNLFQIRERKYEIGVLAAIGMKKWKISIQFLAELLCITFLALIIGAGAGAATSVPLTNAFLAQQVESFSDSSETQNERFGREMSNPPEMPQNDNSTGDGNIKSNGSRPDDAGKGQPFGQAGAAVANYIDSVSSATNLTVLFQLIGIGILLTLISGCTALIFIMRYDPLRILSNRD